MLWVLKRTVSMRRFFGSFEHPNHMFKLMDKKIIAILRLFFYDENSEYFLTVGFCFITEDMFKLKMVFCDIFGHVGQTLATQPPTTVIIPL